VKQTPKSQTSQLYGCNIKGGFCKILTNLAALLTTTSRLQTVQPARFSTHQTTESSVLCNKLEVYVVSRETVC